jgi:hypothetical protein
LSAAAPPADPRLSAGPPGTFLDFLGILGTRGRLRAGHTLEAMRRDDGLIDGHLRHRIDRPTGRRQGQGTAQIAAKNML